MVRPLVPSIGRFVWVYCIWKKLIRWKISEMKDQFIWRLIEKIQFSPLVFFKLQSRNDFCFYKLWMFTTDETLEISASLLYPCSIFSHFSPWPSDTVWKEQAIRQPHFPRKWSQRLLFSHLSSVSSYLSTRDDNLRVQSNR